MDSDQIAETLSTRPYDGTDRAVTMSVSVDIMIDEKKNAQLSVEYKPEATVLEEDAFEALADVGYFKEVAADEIVHDVYYTLVDLLFERHAYVDEPWEHVPLVVDLQYGMHDWENYHASIGQFR